MKISALTLLLASLAVPTVAQNACVSPSPVGDPCMVGHWIGENTAPARIRDALQGVAPDSVIREIETASSPALFSMTTGDGGVAGPVGGGSRYEPNIGYG